MNRMIADLTILKGMLTCVITKESEKVKAYNLLKFMKLLMAADETETPITTIIKNMTDGLLISLMSWVKKLYGESLDNPVVANDAVRKQLTKLIIDCDPTVNTDEELYSHLRQMSFLSKLSCLDGEEGVTSIFNM